MIAIGSDHGGYHLKQYLKEYLTAHNIPVLDVGTDSETSCDYPVYAHKLCEQILNGTCEKGILVCGTGIGMSISANKHKGIRAAACSDAYSAKYSRLHNDANVLCIGERVIGCGLAVELVEVFLSASFEGGRHQRRVDQMERD